MLEPWHTPFAHLSHESTEAVLRRLRVPDALEKMRQETAQLYRGLLALFDQGPLPSEAQLEFSPEPAAKLQVMDLPATVRSQEEAASTELPYACGQCSFRHFDCSARMKRDSMARLLRPQTPKTPDPAAGSSMGSTACRRAGTACTLFDSGMAWLNM